MAEEAVVTLKAIDEISGPVRNAITAMQELEKALANAKATSIEASSASAASAEGLSRVGSAAAATVVPHRAAHQAMTLVTGQLAEMAGASTAAQGALRVADSVLLQMAITGGAVSAGFIAIVAVVTTVSSVFSTMSAASHKATEELQKLHKAQEEAAISAKGLDESLRRVAALSAGEVAKGILETKARIGEATEELAKLRSITVSYIDAEEAVITGQASQTSAFKGSNEEIQRQTSIVTTLTQQLADLQRRQDTLKNASIAYTKQLVTEGEAFQRIIANTNVAINTGINAYERHAKAIEASSRALGFFNDVAETTGFNIINLRDRFLGANEETQRFAQASVAAGQVVMSAFQSMAQGVGQAIGEMITTGEFNWKKFLGSMIKTVLDAAEQIVIIWMAVSTMMTLGLGPLSIPAGFAALAVIEVAKAFIGAELTGPTSVRGQGSTGGSVTSPTSPAGGAGIGAAAGPGGRAVATAQREITNNISINLPVQALSLASVSDTQMKDLAFRVGKALREAAALGQFSLT